MTAAILGLGTASPPYIYNQDEVAEKFISMFNLDEAKSRALRQLYQNTGITKRHSIQSDFKNDRQKWHFWGEDYPKTVPGMGKRNLIYKQEAPKLAIQAAEKALQNWGGNPSELTHVISVSCTGMYAPGIEFELMQALQLNPSVNRLGINFMGCFGAFKGLSVARAFALENPQNRILVVCTELCSLHLQASQDLDTILGNAIFSDGAAAIVVGSGEKGLWQIANLKSIGLQNSTDKMSWEASDTGFQMKLSHKVPVLLGRHIQSFVHDLLPQGLKMDNCDWPIHPGGKSILQAIEKALGLNKSQTQASWSVLSDYGNMSSCTFLFVLERLMQQEEQKPWAVGLAFGPGLSLEGAVFKRLKDKG